MDYISFDIATKSLAMAVIQYKPGINDRINREYELYKLYEHRKSATWDGADVDVFIQILGAYNRLLTNVISLLDSHIKVVHLEVKDLIPDKSIKETNTVQRTIMLYKYLESKRSLLCSLIRRNPPYFIIEYQMGPNDKSRAIAAQVLFYCNSFFEVGMPPSDIENHIKIVGPSLKNKIYYPNDEKSQHLYYLDKYSKNYTANKAHTKYLLKKIIGRYSTDAVREAYEKIKKSNLDDVADAVCMSIGFYLKSLS